MSWTFTLYTIRDGNGVEQIKNPITDDFAVLIAKSEEWEERFFAELAAVEPQPEPIDERQLSLLELAMDGG